MLLWVFATVVLGSAGDDSLLSGQVAFTFCPPSQNRVLLFDSPTSASSTLKLKCDVPVTVVETNVSVTERVKIRTASGNEGFIAPMYLSLSAQKSKAAAEEAKEKQRASKEQQKLEDAQPANMLIRCSPGAVRASLVSVFTSQGYAISDDAESHVTFWREMSGLNGALTQALIGNAYSEAPKQSVVFNFAPAAGGVYVTTAAEISTRMAFGNVNRVSLNQNKNWKRQLKDTLAGVALNCEPLEAQRQAGNGSPAAPSESGTKLMISSDPATAEIYVDGNFVGSTPSETRATSGLHLIVVRKRGYKDWSRSMTVSNTPRVNVHADLEKE